MLLKGRKIKRLIEEFAKAETNKDELQIIDELRQFQKAAFIKVIEQIQQRNLKPNKAELLLEKLCEDAYAENIVSLISSPDTSLVARNIILKRLKRSSLPYLIAYLDRPDLRAKNTATDIIISLKDDSCVPILIDKYRTGDQATKKNILKILGKTGGQAARYQILKALEDESVQVVVAAVRIIESMGDPQTVEPLIAKLTSRDSQVKRSIIEALRVIGDKRASRPMLAILKDNDMRVRQEAIDCIIKISDADIVPDIMKLLGDEDVNVRRCAVEVLNKIHDPKASAALIQAIKDSDWWVRQIATDTLAEMKGDIVIKSFIGLAHEKDINLRRCVVEFFNQVPDLSALATLIELLKDEDWWVRDKAVIALGKLKDPRAIGPLAALIHDEETKGTIPSALAEIGGVEVIKPLRRFLYEDQKRVRVATIKAFSALKSVEAVPDLKGCLSDPDEDIRNESIKALKEITGRVFKPEDASASGRPLRPTPARDAPATEAILVLDVCNSTDIAARYGDDFALNLLHKLFDLVTPIAELENHQFIKSTGDGFLITFPTVGNSVRFALNVLDDLKEYNQKVDNASKINLRFAINFGETRTDDTGDKHGTAVNMTFRVEGVKAEDLIPIENGMAKEDMPLENRILVTENVTLEPHYMDHFQTRLVGLFKLKGITGLHKIFQLVPVK
ncbi:MAG: HEAT repeat domain-containing protein [Deltaproteobacteria bacterium]|nr:HEAT repeat domain-containing protein [Deltaproteobacteria bacterium]